MFCWKCGCENAINGKVSFRAYCEKCDYALHSCKNCKYYKPGAHNDCLVPGTEPISDREANNFCEEYRSREAGPIPNSQSDGKKKFEDLFNQ